MSVVVCCGLLKSPVGRHHRNDHDTGPAEQCSHGPLWVPAAVRRPVQHHLPGRVLLRHRVRRGHGIRALLVRQVCTVHLDHVLRGSVSHCWTDHVTALVSGGPYRQRQVYDGRPPKTPGRANFTFRPAWCPVEVSSSTNIIISKLYHSASTFTQIHF